MNPIFSIHDKLSLSLYGELYPQRLLNVPYDTLLTIRRTCNHCMNRLRIVHGKCSLCKAAKVPNMSTAAACQMHCVAYDHDV